MHFQAPIAFYTAAFPGSKIPYNPRKPTRPSPSASVSPVTAHLALMYPSKPPSVPHCSTQGVPSVGVSVLTKLKMSPRSCSMGTAWARSSMARSTQGYRMLAMVGSLVLLPPGRRVLYSRWLCQLMWLLLSRPSSWHQGSEASAARGVPT